MKIRIKLYAHLADYLPAGAERNEMDLEMPEGATARRALMRLGVPEEACRRVLVNGAHLAPEERDTRPLEAGDHVAVWPPEPE